MYLYKYIENIRGANMGYRIGLDIGITSIGWATVNICDGKMMSIGGLGVRIFDKPENPKNGASLALPRRQARSMRRRLRRHKHRLERIKQLIEDKGIMTKEQLSGMYNANQIQPDVYRLRYEALERLLSPEEFVRVLIHIAQRRGFKSNRKSEAVDADSGKQLMAIEKNRWLMQQKGYRTVGEMLYRDPSFSQNKRNKEDDYSHTMSRQLLLDEIAQIFLAQRNYDNKFADEETEANYTDIFASQRSFDQGPGGNSVYGGNQIEKMLGHCTFEPEEKRAVKASYTFELFMLLNKINNLRIAKTGEGYRSLTVDERKKLMDEAYLSNEIKYAKLRKILGMSPSETFKGLSYGRKEIAEVEKAVFVKLSAYHEIRKALNKIEKNLIKKLSAEQLDAIGYALTVYKNDVQITQYLVENVKLKPEIIEQLLPLSFNKTGHLSIKAIKKILPYIKNGMDYDKACLEAGYDFRGHCGSNKGLKLPPIDFNRITNPVVKRALSQSVKVINAIIDRYGSPDSINIELAREMSKNFRERNEAQHSMEQNQAENEKLRQRLIHEFGISNPKGEDIVKFKLYNEQDGLCFYSGKKLNLERVFFDSGYAEVDHIIPYSISFDDSYKNKVLVRGSENRQKGNRLPLEYLQGDPERLERYIILVENSNLPYLKKQRLLKKAVTPQEEEEFKERNLNDTRYITRELANHIRDHLQFAETEYPKLKRVTSVNGQVTAYMRKRWGLTKLRDNGNLHHALDAVVIACIDDGIIQRVSRYHKQKERLFMGQITYVDRSTGEIITREEYDKTHLIKDEGRFPEPWPKFRKEVEARLSADPAGAIRYLGLSAFYDANELKPIFVSRAPRRKNNGQGHLETIRSNRLINDGFTLTKTPLANLKYKNGEIVGYYNPESDLLLYTELCKRLAEYNGDAKKAFSNPIYKPTAEGKPGPIVKKVKILEKSTLGVAVHGGKGYASNGSMVRIDIFKKDGKHYFVPIYAADTVKPTLPNKAVVAGKAYEEWLDMDECAEFLFCLYPNDLIRIEHRKGVNVTLLNGQTRMIKEGFLYYKKASISTASITAISHDNSYEIPSLGIMTLQALEKWQVNYLGEVQKVNREKRLTYEKRSH